MRILFVTAVEQGSGETITCLHMAESLVAAGNEVLFLASRFAARFLGERFAARVRLLGERGADNVLAWERAVRELEPDAVVFADYPLLFFPVGTAPLGAEPGFAESLERLGSTLVTLDHFGFAQREMNLFMGPPHLSFHYQRIPPIPERMRIMLPCPMHEPGPVSGRRGEPFRYWPVPLPRPEDTRDTVRRTYLGPGDGRLLLYLVSNWAWRGAETLGLPLYEYLPRILDHYLAGVTPPVTVVSVNNGELFTASSAGLGTRFVDLGPLPKDEFERLLSAADLVVTDNGVSISIGKAVCSLQTCATLRNGYTLPHLASRLDGRLREVLFAMEARRIGAIYPFEVYPVGMIDELRQIGLYRENSLVDGFRRLELFGGDETARQLRALLTDEGERARLRSDQWRYVERLAATGDCVEVLHRLIEANEPAGPDRRAFGATRP